VLADPRPDGTETFFRNGRQEFTNALQPRVPPPMRATCGPVAMSQTSTVMTIDLKRTSATA